MRRALCSTWWPCGYNADWCLRSDVTSNSRPQGCKAGAGRCIPSANANAGHAEYATYLADALANSWSRNLGIDGFIVDTSFQIPCAPGTNKDYGAPGGTEHIFYNQIIGEVRKTQPQVVLSGEDCASWDDAIQHNFQLPGTKVQHFPAQFPLF